MSPLQTLSDTLNDKHKPVYTIGIVAELIGVSVHSLRMYETEGLLSPKRTNSKRRLYSQADIERLKCIRIMIEENGLNLAGIKMMLSMAPCLDMIQCSDKDRKNCDAYTSTLAPCWSLTNVGECCKMADCRDCMVYQDLSTCHNMKTFLKENWKGK